MYCDRCDGIVLPAHELWCFTDLGMFEAAARRLGRIYDDPATGCWVWCRKNGQPFAVDVRPSVMGKRIYVRVLEAKLGRVMLPREFSCHTCDRGHCVHPDHLFPGSALDNARDMVAKGRWKGGAPKKV